MSAIETSESYQVRLEVFEGPLDLLLFLIRKKKIDIHNIPIAVITREYLDYLDRKEQINLDREAEFLLMAALLIHIKSQMLLPREQALAEGEDPRRFLVDRLVEYQKIKAACSLLREREEEQLPCGRANFLPPLPGEDELDFIEVSLFRPGGDLFRPDEAERSGEFPGRQGQELFSRREDERDHRRARERRASSISWSTSNARKPWRRRSSPSSVCSSSSRPGW